MTQRAILYARVSGDDRHTEGRNLAGQLALCRAYAAERGYSVLAELAEDDRGASGAAFELPQLNRIRELAEQGAFDVLVVRELDRLSRDLLKQLLVEHELKRAGIAIEYAIAEYPNTPEGRLNKHIRAVIAQFERELIGQRIERGRLRALAAGSVIGGQAPFGYRLVRDGARWLLVVEPAEAAIVLEIVRLYLSGLSYFAIAQELTARGIPTAVDTGASRSRKVRRVGEWSAATIGGILRNETYAGTWHYRKRTAAKDAADRTHYRTRPAAEWVAVPVPAILDAATWAAVVAQRAQNTITARRNLRHVESYLLRGRVTCGLCGGQMYGLQKPSGPPGRVLAYYQCGRALVHRNYLVHCPARLFRAERVDAVAWGWLRDLIMDEAALEAGLAELAARDAEPPAEDETDVSVQLADLERQAARAYDGYVAGLVSREAFERQSRTLAGRRAHLEEQQRAALARAADAAAVQAATQDLRTQVAELRAKLPANEAVFAFRRFVVERLDLRAVLVRDDAGPRIRLTCRLAPAGAELPLS